MPSKRQFDAHLLPFLGHGTANLRSDLGLVAPKEVTLLFEGESGTGKEVFAKLAHDLSRRRNGAFVPINCAAIPDALFESELFGHEKGSFTGATKRAKGKIEAASGGTLFLDEVGELPLALQSKLLRFLETRLFMRVGGVEKLPANLRLMSATAKNLESEVRAGRFRADLFYRLQGVALFVPPLRDRREDIWPLAQVFSEYFAKMHEVEPPKISRAARQAIMHHSWPGNVRELRTLIEKLVLFRGGRHVRSEHLPPAFRAETTRLDSSEGPSRFDEAPLDELVAEIVSARLRKHAGDRIATAHSLGISLRTLQRYVSDGRVKAIGRA